VKEFHLKNDVFITSRYETGNGRSFKRKGPNHFAFTPEKDPEKVRGRPYGGLIHHFSFRVRNLRRLNRMVRFDAERINHPYGSDACVWIKRGKSWRFAEKADCDIEWGKRFTRLSFRFNLLAGEEVEVSESFNYSYREVKSALEQSVKKFPQLVELESIGATAGGKDLLCLQIGKHRARAKRFLIAATPQASEMGALGCFAAIAELCGNTLWAKTARNNFVYYILPCTNPDGVDLGHCMVNSLGENPIFEARAASEGKKVSREMKALWNFASRIKPDVFLGYHSYFQSHYFMTGLRPWGIYMFDRLLLNSPKKKKAADIVNDKLLDLKFGQCTYNRVGGPFSDCLPHVLQEKFETLSYWLKLSTRMDYAANEKKALEVLKTVVNNYSF